MAAHFALADLFFDKNAPLVGQLSRRCSQVILAMQNIFGLSKVMLGIVVPQEIRDASEWSRRRGYTALLNAIILYERSHGRSVTELAQVWRIQKLEGIEERWRDDMLWLLSGISNLLDLRSFFYHLKEYCHADQDRIRRVKQILRHHRRKTYELQDMLKYCSPLGSVLHGIRRSHSASPGAKIGFSSIRKLEQAGITSPQSLVSLSVSDMTALGLQRRFAVQIRDYVMQRMQ